ncbi:serine/threonine protein kinase [Streptomyces sp. SBT349]|uniref:serine/threonine protein kinase n=1 Tax=Streptomyces sp. SBT349 TaxID=1580539 RepID=UPI000A7A2059|nr:serine/threonine protein kinase [Streptomyces sp. SBT349]
MESYAGRLLADRYRLPRTPSDEFELIESRAFDTASGQEVLVRQVPLPEVVEAETLDEVGRPRPAAPRSADRATRLPDDPVVRRAVEAAAAAARLPDHPRLDQVFDVFVQGDGLWIVSELVPARPLAAVLAEERLGPFRAAEVAADLLAALRIVHAQGWTHRNVTARTVLICEDGRAVLTGLAAGAAEEVLCGYDPLPSDLPDTFAAGPRPPQAERQVAPERQAPPGDRQQPPAQLQPPPQRHQPPSAEDHGDLAARVRRQGGLPPGFHLQGNGPGEPGQGPQGPTRPGSPGPHGQGQHGQSPLGQGQHGQGQHGSRPQGAYPQPYAGQPWGDPEVPPPDAYRRWETGSVPRVEDPGQEHGPSAGPGGGAGAAGFVARVRQQGGSPHDAEPGEYPEGHHPEPGHGPGYQGHPPHPQGGERLPATWDFEGGADAPGQGGRPPTAAERAARSGAIAAYRAGTQAGAAQRTGGSGPTELPGPGRPSHPVRTGWEPTPRQAGALPAPRQHAGEPPPDRPDERPHETVVVPGGEDRYRGPDSALAAERARQARIATVGAVTERWAPEQAGPVYANWRLAPPVGPPADFWALGALLFRAVQGYPPYPEESAAELTQAVCAEQPAFAEDCGALRPIIESLLRQDPTERLSAEELRGWLRSLLRSAPEPEVGRHTVTAPPALEPGRPAAPRRLPIVRRRGELVGPRRRPRPRGPRNPRRLGRALLTLVLLGLAGAVAYVVTFMSGDDRSDDRGSAPPGPESQEPAGRESPGEEQPGPSSQPTEDATEPSPAEEDSHPAPPPSGFTVVEDDGGFSAAVPEGWERQAENADGQIVYSGEGLQLLFVPGRDSTAEFASEPSDYQLREQRELDAYRAYQYGVSTGLFEDRVGDISVAEGIFDWLGDDGERRAYNRVLLIDGFYHVVMVVGPADQRDRLGEIYDVTAESYRAGD